jgi:hypothetical protein
MAEIVHLALAVELTEPVNGSISGPGEDRHDFCGWLEMHAIVEEFCARARDASASVSTTRGQGSER